MSLYENGELSAMLEAWTADTGLKTPWYSLSTVAIWLEDLIMVNYAGKNVFLSC